MKTSDKGIALLKEFEGMRLSAYPDPATGGEPITIGFGSTLLADGSKVKMGMKITEAEAEELLRATLGKYEQAVEKSVTRPLKQHQFDACVSLTYNIGEGNWRKSSVLRHINAGNFTNAADAFLMWNKAAGKVLPGLVRRRKAERNMFLGA